MGFSVSGGSNEQVTAWVDSEVEPGRAPFHLSGLTGYVGHLC